MILIIIIFVICALLYKVFFVDKIHVDFKSFLKRGFKKTDNQFGLLCYTGKQRKGQDIFLYPLHYIAEINARLRNNY